MVEAVTGTLVLILLLMAVPYFGLALLDRLERWAARRGR